MKLGFFAVLALSILSPAVLAAAVDDYAKLYATTAEANQTAVTPVSYAGIQYYLVSVAGKEAVVLKDAGNNKFSAITDEATLEPLLKVYIGEKYGTSITDAQVSKIKSAYAATLAVSDVCTDRMALFLSGTWMLSYIKQTDDRGSRVPKTAVAIAYLLGKNDNGSLVPVTGVTNVDAIIAHDTSGKGTSMGTGTHAVISGGMDYLGDIILDISTDKPASQISESLKTAKTLVAELKPVADKYKADYNYLYKIHMPMFNNIDCGFSSANFGDLESSLSIGLADVPTEKALASAIINATAARSDTFEAVKVYATVQGKLNDAYIKYSQLKSRMYSAGLETTSLDVKIEDLNATAAAVGTLTSKTAAQAEAEKFNDKLTAAVAYMNFIGSDDMFDQLNASNHAFNSAQMAIDLAVARMDEGNSQVAELKTSYATLKVELDQAKADLARGEFDGKKSQIQNITSDIALIQARADGLAPGQGIDMTIVGGAILLLLVLGAYYKYSTRKPPGVVPAPQQPSGIIIEKKGP